VAKNSIGRVGWRTWAHANANESMVTLLDCKSLIPGSNPGAASSKIGILRDSRHLRCSIGKHAGSIGTTLGKPRSCGRQSVDDRGRCRTSPAPGSPPCHLPQRILSRPRVPIRRDGPDPQRCWRRPRAQPSARRPGASRAEAPAVLDACRHALLQRASSASPLDTAMHEAPRAESAPRRSAPNPAATAASTGCLLATSGGRS